MAHILLEAARRRADNSANERFPGVIPSGASLGGETEQNSNEIRIALRSLVRTWFWTGGPMEELCLGRMTGGNGLSAADRAGGIPVRMAKDDWGAAACAYGGPASSSIPGVVI